MTDLDSVEIVVGAAVLGIVVYLLKRNSSDTVQQGSASDSSNGSASFSDSAASKPTGSTSSKPATTGGDDSTITME